MPNDDRDRPRWSEGDRGRDRWGGDEAPNRGMFGYEGEGYMRGGARGMEREFDERDREYGGRDRDTGVRRGGFRHNDYRDFNRGDYSRGDFNRGGRDFGELGRHDRTTSGGFGQSYGSDRAVQSFRGRGPKNYQRSDDRIREDVCERLADDDAVDASDIEVSVNGGTVTLGGTVSDRLQKRRAEDLVESCSGVREVENHLRVGRIS